MSLFDIVVGLACSKDPERYVGSSVTTGMTSHARRKEKSEGAFRGEARAQKGL